ncbi:MAG TPA: hypothetical protein PLS69_10145 [Terricaulis sp.]|nr:hypothetical protein [Terricaulis sp.]
MNWFADKLGPMPVAGVRGAPAGASDARMNTGQMPVVHPDASFQPQAAPARPAAAPPQPAPQPPPQAAAPRPAPQPPAPPPEPEKKKKKGWF